MMETIMLFFSALVDLSNAMAPYILFGLVFAGFLHELVPDSIVKNHLGKDSVMSVIKATVFGIPLPVCSCGVIPLAAGIKKSGASNGSTLSFLISTPITGIDSILATYGMFGWIFTIYRVVTSMIISILAGLLSNFYAHEEKEETVQKKPAFSMAAPTKNTSVTSFSAVATPVFPKDTNSEKRGSMVTRAFSYAFGTLLKDIASPLLIGLLVGALITVAVPDNLSEILIKYNWLSYIIVIAIAVPMYVCATASLPIAAGLMLAGVSPGAAFVFLSAGPATNTVTIGVVKKMLGTRTLYIYLGTIIAGSLLFGLGLDYLFRDVNVKELVHMDGDAGLTAWIASLVLWGFVLYYVIKPYFFKDKECNDGSCCSA
ncbi:SO_0444 family Cu/Zn efflux transporter [Sulfurimonas sp. SWIR-19]|uniref:SO_0444 family Cu/Zn efflux transporter n=1 Tax=Sulfurimonas sp. SWIR-19 TaxID=2878390 RepID=UPI001CF545FE|nr:SO_0444 family Cu/Zn efflux transporter [Sulfurimonas sp. SWIR-19]UCN00353.1 SO_0444 family Cu/Zn efflux transporter [Sulfurimonas sp. SWIR-19]